MSSRIEQIIEEIEEYIDSCKFQPLSTTKIIVNKDEIDELDTFINENLWNVLNKKINNFFDSITLEDLVNQYNESKSNILYYI